MSNACQCSLQRDFPDFIEIVLTALEFLVLFAGLAFHPKQETTMYLDYFSLNRHPFRITPDPSLFYPGGADGRGVILNALIYGITSGEGILKVVGEVGSGKTMLCRMLEEELPDTIEIVYIANPSLSAREILYAIAIELKLDVSSSTERLKVLHMIQDYLLRKHGKGGSVVVFIEEAQSMPIETLEEIRLLSNLETYQHKLMQIVLFGQPELDKILAEKNIRQLRERITHSFRLEPLSPRTTGDYLKYRLKAAGCPRSQLFSPRAEKMIARASSGLTRRINILADKSLLAAYAESPSRQPQQDSDEPLVLARHVRAAIHDTDYKRNFFNPWMLGGLAMTTVAIVLAVLTMTGVLPTGSLFTSDSAEVAVNQTMNTAAEVSVLPGSNPGDSPGNAEVLTDQRSEIQGNIAREPEEELSTAAALIAEAVETVQPQEEQTAEEILPASRPEEDVVTVSSEAEPIEIPAPATESFSNQEQVVEESDEPPELLASASIDENTSAAGSSVETAANQLVVPEEEPERVLYEEETVAEVEEREVVQAAEEIPEEPVAAIQEVVVPPAPPVVVLPSGLTELRMPPTASWLQSLSEKSGYTIQLFSVPSTNPNGLEEYLQFLQLVSLLEDTYICFMPISSENSGRWQVMHKEFEGVTPARNLIDTLPVYIRQYGPYVRNLNGVECSYPYETR